MARSAATIALVATPLVSLVLVLVLGSPMIRWLRRIGALQRVRDDGPQRHLEKEGTPTMGGIVIVGATLMAVLIGGALVLPRTIHAGFGHMLLVTAGATVAFACIGLTDDWKKVRHGRSLGLRARSKLAFEFLAAAALVVVLVWGERQTQFAYHGHANTWVSFAPWAAFWVLAVVAGSNAMNLADGLDGLAAGLSVIAAAGAAAVWLPTVSFVWFGFALLPLALGGACLGFLWFNRHPARVFMGDVGSLGVGAGIAATAALSHNPVLLIGLCLVPFVEMLSVIIQVISFKTTGKRVFKMSPIHHHFELIGWSERRVVWTFWAVGAVAAVVTVWVCAVWLCTR